MTRPSEGITAAVGSVIGAVFAILIGYGIDVPDGVEAGAVVIVSWIAFFVTLFVARKQRAGTLKSLKDGRVK